MWRQLGALILLQFEGGTLWKLQFPEVGAGGVGDEGEGKGKVFGCAKKKCCNRSWAWFDKKASDWWLKLKACKEVKVIFYSLSSLEGKTCPEPDSFSSSSSRVCSESTVESVFTEWVETKSPIGQFENEAGE